MAKMTEPDRVTPRKKCPGAESNHRHGIFSLFQPLRESALPSGGVRQARAKTRRGRYAEARSCTVPPPTRRQQAIRLRWDHDGCPRAVQRLGGNGGDAGRSGRSAERLETEPAPRSGDSSCLSAPIRQHRCFAPALAPYRAGSQVARTRLEQAGKQRAGPGLAGSPRNADGTDRLARRPQGTRREGATVGGARRARRVTSSGPETTSTENSPITGRRRWPGNGGSS